MSMQKMILNKLTKIANEENLVLRINFDSSNEGIGYVYDEDQVVNIISFSFDFQIEYVTINWFEGGKQIRRGEIPAKDKLYGSFIHYQSDWHLRDTFEWFEKQLKVKTN